MKGDRLHDLHHVVSYVSGSRHHEGLVDGSVFMRRTADTDGLSVNWLECFPSPRANQISEICARSRISVRATGRFAEINVGEAIEAVSSVAPNCSAVHDPLAQEGEFREDPSHALFIGLPEASESERALLAGDLISQRVKALHKPVL